MSDIDFNKILGINISLKEWEYILNERKISYMVFHDVKKLDFQEFKIKENNIPVVLLMKSSHWMPKYSKAWGSCGPDGERGFDIENYGLTNEEIRNLIGHLLDDKIEFRTTEKNMRQWKGDKEIIPPRCQHIVTKNNCDNEKAKELDKMLKEEATKKFETKDTTKNNYIYIDDIMIRYTSTIKERKGKYKKVYNCPTIWG